MKRILVVVIVLVALASILSAQSGSFDPGIEVGKKIPAFKLEDQKGHLQEYATLKGPQGLVLLFFRSADW